MDDYTLIALNNEPSIISLSTKYMKERTNLDYLEHYKIEYIDFLTSRYDSNKLKEELLKNGKIDNLETELFIFRNHKFNGKIKTKFYPIISKEDLTDEYKKIITKKINGEIIKIEDMLSLLSSFYNKYRMDAEFKKIVDYYYTDLNEHTLKKLRIIYSKMTDPLKRQIVKEEEVSYREVRKLFMLTMLYKKFKNFDNYNNYLNEAHVYENKNREKINKLIDKDNITGQIELIFNRQK